MTNFKNEQPGNDFYNATSSNWKQDSMKPGLQKMDSKTGLQSMKTLPGNLQSPLAGIQSLPNLNKGKTTSSSFKSEIWVKKWVDYSTKYGLGYLLTNGATGVFYNDSTKLILDPKGVNFEYYERRMSDKQDVVSSYSMTNYPPELQKKVTLLQHFKSYLEGDKAGEQAPEQIDDSAKSQSGNFRIVML